MARDETDEAKSAEALGRFGHHPNPAIDFCVEAEILEAVVFGIGFDFLEPDTVGGVKDRLTKALEFRVGSGLRATATTDLLRDCEAKLGVLRACEQRFAEFEEQAS
jgi:hypothetical protein